MTVDIIIPTYKPDETLCLLLHGLREQTFVIHRVILLNTEEKLWEKAVSAYPIEQILEELPCPYTVKQIKKSEFDHGGTRRLGAKISDADVVIFMTQDAVPADTHLTEKLMEALGQENVAVAYERQLPKEDCHIAEQYTRQFNYPDESSVKTKIGGALIYKPIKKTFKRYMADDKGGAPLLGLKGLVVKIHGNSKDTEVRSAIEQCRNFVKKDVTNQIIRTFVEEENKGEN